MPSDLETYRQTLLDLYLRLPDTPAVSAASTCAWSVNSGSGRSR